MQHEKVHFQLPQDADGYPPVAVESVWAIPAGAPDQFKLDNVPFFARQATLGDTVVVRRDGGGLWFQAVVARSENSLLRVVFFDVGQKARVEQLLLGLGCSTEYIGTHKLLAVNVPGTVVLADVQRLLAGEAQGGCLDYEEPILRQ